MRRIEDDRFTVPKKVTYCDRCGKQTYVNLATKQTVHMNGKEECQKPVVGFKKKSKDKKVETA